jgi:hypothetical protein
VNGNHCQLEGTIWRDAWTRTPASNPQAIQVRCWLTRPTARVEFRDSRLVNKREFFLCLIVPKSADELRLLERELQTGRQVTITGRLQMAGTNGDGPPDEWQPGVILVAESYNIHEAPAAAPREDQMEIAVR